MNFQSQLQLEEDESLNSLTEAFFLLDIHDNWVSKVLKMVLFFIHLSSQDSLLITHSKLNVLNEKREWEVLTYVFEELRDLWDTQGVWRKGGGGAMLHSYFVITSCFFIIAKACLGKMDLFHS